MAWSLPETLFVEDRAAMARRVHTSHGGVAGRADTRMPGSDARVPIQL